MILRFSYARFHFVYIKQLTGLFGEISENSSRLQTNAWNFKCNFAGGGTVYKLNFVSGALESSTRQRLPIIQNLMQTVSTLSKSIYIYISEAEKWIWLAKWHTVAFTDLRFSTRPFHHFSPLPFLPFLSLLWMLPTLASSLFDQSFSPFRILFRRVGIEISEFVENRGCMGVALPIHVNREIPLFSNDARLWEWNSFHFNSFTPRGSSLLPSYSVTHPLSRIIINRCFSVAGIYIEII